MNGKNIKKHLNNKLRDWILNIDDENIKKNYKRQCDCDWWCDCFASDR